MGVLDSLFGKSTKIENEFFGTMNFVEARSNSHKSYFECRRHFKPSGKIIEIGIDRDREGISNKQIDFFKSIEDNYPEISQAITSLIEDEFGNWKEGFKIINFQKEFWPVYLQITECKTTPVIWEIVFESEHDPNHVFTLTMSDFEAKEILIDG